jgi:septum formation topological specificity factor MinE
MNEILEVLKKSIQSESRKLEFQDVLNAFDMYTSKTISLIIKKTNTFPLRL